MDKRTLIIIGASLLIGFFVGNANVSTHPAPPIPTKHVKKIVDVVTHNHFDPDRSSAYTCKTQPPDSNAIGMICNSPSGDITISCTITIPNTSQYFC